MFYAAILPSVLAADIAASNSSNANINTFNATAANTNAVKSGSTLYKVKIEHGQFSTRSGAKRTYTLYVPEANSTLPGPPYPVVVLIHGFLMTGDQHKNNAQSFAERGFIAITPDLTKVLLGDDTRMGNVRDVLDEITWLELQSSIAGNPLYGMVDPTRVGIAGNSAGGAVCLELLLEAQKEKIPIQAMCSLDGVPWDRTWGHMTELQPVKILSLRAEPSLCNFHARMLLYLARLKFPFDDVKINGAHHCDVENPTTLGCRCVCGRSDEKYRHIFQRLTYLYFRDVFHAPSFDPPTENFIAAVHNFQSDDKVIANLMHMQPEELASK